MMIGYILSRVVDLYSLILLFWIITSWFPQLRRHQIVRAVGRVCEPPLEIARRIIPSTGGVDFSPMLVLFLLQLVANGLRGAAF